MVAFFIRFGSVRRVCWPSSTFAVRCRRRCCWLDFFAVVVFFIALCFSLLFVQRCARAISLTGDVTLYECAYFVVFLALFDYYSFKFPTLYLIHWTKPNWAELKWMFVCSYVSVHEKINPIYTHNTIQQKKERTEYTQCDRGQCSCFPYKQKSPQRRALIHACTLDIYVCIYK